MNNTLSLNYPVQINFLSSSGTGNYPLIDYNVGGGWTPRTTGNFTLPSALPNRATGYLVVNPSNPNELDLDVTGLASIVWAASSATSGWNTTSPNWVVQNSSVFTSYIDPTDSVILDDSAGTAEGLTALTVVIGPANVSPNSVIFNNNSVTYSLSGSNGITGKTGLSLTGTGTVILMTSNSYTGPTTIGLGATLQLGNGSPGNDGNIVSTSGIADNGTLIYNNLRAAVRRADQRIGGLDPPERAPDADQSRQLLRGRDDDLRRHPAARHRRGGI